MGEEKSEKPAVEKMSVREEEEEEEDDDEVWCVCGFRDIDGVLVQCEECQVWQHANCVDYNATKHPQYTCVRCLLQEVLSHYHVPCTRLRYTILLAISYLSLSFFISFSFLLAIVLWNYPHHCP